MLWKFRTDEEASLQTRKTGTFGGANWDFGLRRLLFSVFGLDVFLQSGAFAGRRTECMAGAPSILWVSPRSETPLRQK